MTEKRLYQEGSRVEGLDLSGVHLHDADFEDAKLTDANLIGADMGSSLRINGGASLSTRISYR